MHPRPLQPSCPESEGGSGLSGCGHVNQQVAVYTHHGLFFSLKEEGGTDARYPRVNLEDTTLVGTRQWRKDKPCLIPPTRGPRVLKTTDTERTVAPRLVRAWGGTHGQGLVSVCGDRSPGARQGVWLHQV